MKKRLTTIAAAGVLGLGGVASTFVLAPAVVAAATSDTTTSEALADRVDRLRNALSGLVDDGTLTDAQAKKVAERLADQLPARHGFGHEGFDGNLNDVAEVLDMSQAEVISELQDGRSLVDVAADQGVGARELVDQLVTMATKRINEAVADDRLTRSLAQRLKSDLETRITDQVERAGLPDVRGGMSPHRGVGAESHGGSHLPGDGSGAAAPDSSDET